MEENEINKSTPGNPKNLAILENTSNLAKTNLNSLIPSSSSKDDINTAKIIEEDESDDYIIPDSEEDPFATSGSEDPTYVPSD